MRDYWLTKDLLQAAGIVFMVLSLAGIGLALWLPKKWWGKLLAVIAVSVLISILIYKASQETQQQQVVVDDYKERFAKAQDLRYFDIQWDEEVLLHDGRVIVVHVKRTFERRSRSDRWLAHDRDTEVTFDAGPPWGTVSRNFERYDVNMIENRNGRWYFGLDVTTGIPPKKLVDPMYGVLILDAGGQEHSATSWVDIPDFPRQNMMPVTPSPEDILRFANSHLTWKTKMEHWRENPRAAGDDGLIIQRHANKQGEEK